MIGEVEVGGMTTGEIVVLSPPGGGDWFYGRGSGFDEQCFGLLWPTKQLAALDTKALLLSRCPSSVCDGDGEAPYDPILNLQRT